MDLSRELLTRVPELEERYRREAVAWADYDVELGPDAVFGTVLAPFAIEKLLEEGDNGEILKRIFVFLEDLASSESDTALSAVYVSFGESLLESPLAFDQAKKYMGPETRRGFDYQVEQMNELGSSDRP